MIPVVAGASVFAAYAFLAFSMWLFGHGGDYDTPLKRGRDGWKTRR